MEERELGVAAGDRGHLDAPGDVIGDLPAMFSVATETLRMIAK